MNSNVPSLAYSKVNRIESFKFWTHLDVLSLDKSLVFTKPHTLRFISYSDGSPCIEANMFLHTIARRSKGGAKSTLRTYSGRITHLVNFVERQPYLKKFSDLSDASFRHFIQTLQTERKSNGQLKRVSNTVREIALTCVKFLYFIREFHDLSHFIGTDKSNKIMTEEKVYYTSPEGVKYKVPRLSIIHDAIPEKNEEKRRLPVSANTALKVWRHISNQENIPKRRRDCALYRTMEKLGARVQEIHLITLKDFQNAQKSGNNPYISITNLKRRGDSSNRNIPVTKAYLREIAKYVNIRNNIIRKKGIKDHGFLFISINTGKPLKSSTWTKYFNIWKKELNIKGQLHPHLYRHSFVTDKLKEIILQHTECTDADSFKRTVMHTENFKMKLKEWTGHTNISSLDIYIHLIYDDVNGYAKVYNTLSIKDSISIVEQELDLLNKQLKVKVLTPSKCIAELQSLIIAFKADIEDSIERTDDSLREVS
jgi:site-specific recombinase XerC